MKGVCRHQNVAHKCAILRSGKYLLSPRAQGGSVNFRVMANVRGVLTYYQHSRQLNTRVFLHPLPHCTAQGKGCLPLLERTVGGLNHQYRGGGTVRAHRHQRGTAHLI